MGTDAAFEQLKLRAWLASRNFHGAADVLAVAASLTDLEAATQEDLEAATQRWKPMSQQRFLRNVQELRDRRLDFVTTEFLRALWSYHEQDLISTDQLERHAARLLAPKLAMPLAAPLADRVSVNATVSPAPRGGDKAPDDSSNAAAPPAPSSSPLTTQQQSPPCTATPATLALPPPNQLAVSVVSS